MNLARPSLPRPILCLALSLVAVASAVAASSPPLPSRDPVALLLARLAQSPGLLHGSDQEILRTVLHELAVPVESQVLVFAKTSMQASLISPQHPRALYFSDSVYVGWVPGGLIEVAAIDPGVGPVFYAFDPQDARDARRTFVREKSCLRCHGDQAAPNVAGLLARSVLTNDLGELIDPSVQGLMTDRTAFAERWGGWYVTGYDGPANHRGNAFAQLTGSRPEFRVDWQRPHDVSDRLPATTYLADTSDVLALLVFEHQLAMHNTLARATEEARSVIAKDPSTSSEASRAALDRLARNVVDQLLFRDAAPLPSGLTGNARFKQAFLRDDRTDSAGHSLRTFATSDRLFVNRCSFLIYSDAFAALPTPLKTLVFSHLGAALRDRSPEGRYAYLEPEEKARILQILRETLPEAVSHSSPTSL